MLKNHFFPWIALTVMTIAAMPGQTAGQAFQKAPAGVEAALREKVMSFFNLQKEGKFRQSESGVCADSRDAYYDSDKRRWSSVEITKITFGKNFEEAMVLMALGTELRHQGNRTPAIYPMNSAWRLEAGAWCYYIPPPSKTETITPWGVMRPTDADKGQTKPQIPQIPANASSAMASIYKQIHISKRELRVKGYEASTDQLEIASELQGRLQLGVSGVAPAGLQWSFSKSELGPGEKSVFSLKYNPPDNSPKSTMQISLLLEPFGARVPVTIIFDIPEDVKKSLPPAVQLPQKQ
ncbi:MAG: hypothetical protein HY821_03655 [Acidobacteria bacterium]|nr:hypothetical protein [Acidobacteriota bacterium]